MAEVDKVEIDKVAIDKVEADKRNLEHSQHLVEAKGCLSNDLSPSLNFALIDFLVL